MIAMKNIVIAYLCVVAFTAMSAPNPVPKAVGFFDVIPNLVNKLLGNVLNSGKGEKKGLARPEPEDPEKQEETEELEKPAPKVQLLTFDELKKKTPDEVAKLPIKELKDLKPDQFKELTAEQRKALTEEQRKGLSEEQLKAIK